MKNKNNSKILVAVVTAFIIVIGALSGYFLVSSVKKGSPSLSESSGDISTDIGDKAKDPDADSDNTPKEKSDTSEEKDDTSEEESRREENYTGPTIGQVDQYIYNSDGKVLKDYHGGERYYLEMTVNADASEAILVYNNVCYYIDAELNVTEIATDVSKAGICFDGGYCYYVVGETGTTNQELFIYDIPNQTKESLYKGNVVGASISPNGKVIALFAHEDIHKICTVGIGLEKQTYKVEDTSSVVAVSNDATMIYFNEYTRSDDYFKCIDHEEEITLSNDNLIESYYTKECNQVMYMDDDGVKYYKTGDGEPQILTSETEDLRFNIAGGKKMPISFFSDHYILDTNCFSDALMMYTMEDCYAFSGLIPEIIWLTKEDEKARFFTMAITDEGPTCIGTSDGSLVKFTYDGKEVIYSTLYSTDSISIEFATNKTLDKIWFIKDNDVYYMEEGKATALVADQGNKINQDLMYDPFSDKCFYVKDDQYLCRVGTDLDDNEIVYDDCHMLGSVVGEDHLVGFYDHDSNKYIVIGDEIIQED